jgi:hypothetical protein
MRKTNRTKRKIKPELKWQTGDYARHAEYKFFLPYQFLLLCKLVEISPRDFLCDFMDNLSCGSWKRKGRDIAKEHLINYFIAHGYGQNHYTENELRQIFKEMDAIGMLFPYNGSMKMLDSYSGWRDKQYRFWFKQWWRKPRRKLIKPTQS